jgi:hypothetical protein
MNVFIIKYNENLIGIYNNLDIILDYIYSLYNCNLIKNNIKIEEYKINSYILLNEYEVDLNYNIKLQKKINYKKESNNVELLNFEIESNTSTTNDNISNISINHSWPIPDATIVNIDDNKSEDSDDYYKNKNIIEKYNIIGQEKIDIVHNLNLLKQQKNKEIEKENIYNSDIKIYKILKLKKEKDNKFEIPELFKQKYEIFKNLELNNLLNYENYYKMYEPEQITTSFDNCFNDIDIKHYKQEDNDDENELENIEFKDIERNDLININ